MPSEKSIYNKILVTLKTAKSVKATSKEDLIKGIVEQNSPIYFTYQYDEELDDYESIFSENVVNKTIKLSEDLGLLASNGVLTEAGKEAVKVNMFNVVLSSRISNLFTDYEVEVNLLNEVIKEKLKSEPPIMPTAKELKDSLEIGMSHNFFSRLLTLLAHCGFAKSSQKKIYLSFEENL